jgi:aldehyde dehydrogenase (NAD+)
MTSPRLIEQRATYVASTWVEGDEMLAVENPADETTVCEVSVTPVAEIARAVREARRSVDGGVWAGLPVRDRARVLSDFISYLETVKQPLVATMIAEAGQPTMYAEGAQYSAGINFSRNTIDLYQTLPEEEANPVPVDELVRGRSICLTTPTRRPRRRSSDRSWASSAIATSTTPSASPMTASTGSPPRSTGPTRWRRPR